MTPRPKTSTECLVDLLRHQAIDLVLDVGANRGQYAATLLEAGYSGEIVSFEPLSACHDALVERAAAWPDRWRVAPRMALGDREGEVSLNVSAESDMSSIRDFDAAFLAASPTSAFVGRETVPVVRLDAIFDRHAGAGRRVLLKLDAQGYEREILDGASGVIERIAGIQVEMSLVPLYRGEATFDDMMARMRALGMELFLVIPGDYNRHLGRLLQIDGVFFRPVD